MLVSKWGQGHRRAATEACEGRNGQTQTDRQSDRCRIGQMEAETTGKDRQQTGADGER